MGAKHSNWQLSQNNQFVSYALLSLGGRKFLRTAFKDVAGDVARLMTGGSHAPSHKAGVLPSLYSEYFLQIYRVLYLKQQMTPIYNLQGCEWPKIKNAEKTRTNVTYPYRQDQQHITRIWGPMSILHVHFYGFVGI